MTPAPGSAELPEKVGTRARRRIDLSDLLPRVASGLVLIAIAIGTAVAGGLVFAAFWLVAGIAILWEWQRLIEEGRLPGRVAVGAAAVILATGAAEADHVAWAGPILLCGALGVAALSAQPAMAAAGVYYAGMLPLGLATLRRSDSHGFEAVLWLFAVVWGTDIMAYFGGRLIGGPKLWARVSPSKTWSGFVVGIVSGALAGVAAVAPWGVAWPLVPLGLTAAVVAQGGDLFESSLKRRYGVKDSSRLIPGHGGVMDRLDGFLAAVVFAAAFGSLRHGLDQSAAGLLQW